MSREKVKVKGKGKGKDNVWSIDSEVTKAEKEKEKTRRKKKRGNGRRMTKNTVQKSRCGRVMVSGAMLIETETVLQTQVIRFVCRYPFCISLNFSFFLIDIFRV